MCAVASSAPLPRPTFFAAWIVPEDEEDAASFQYHRRLTVHLIFQRAFDDIDDLFARMPVPAERRSGVQLDKHLDDLASGHAEIVPLEIGTPDSRLLRPDHVQRQTASDDERRHRNGSRCLSCEVSSSA